MASKPVPSLSFLLVFLGVLVSGPEGGSTPAPKLLDLKFKWNGQESIAARGILYGMEYPNIEYAVGRAPAQKGTKVFELSPFPYRFPQNMQATSINAYLDPPLSTDAGVLNISLSWSESASALRDWMENGLHPIQWDNGDSAGIEENLVGWSRDLNDAPPEKMIINVLRVTRTFKGDETKFDTVQMGKSVLTKGSVAEFELALPTKTADEEWITLELPDFSIELERPKYRTPVEWLSPRMKAVRTAAENKAQTPDSSLEVKPNRKRPFWQFWKKGG